MVLQNLIARFKVMCVARQVRQHDDARALVQCLVAGTGKKAARAPAFEMKTTALVVGNQAQGNPAAALQVSNYAAIHSADGLEVSAKYSNFEAESARPLGNKLNSQRAAQHLMLTLAEAKEIIVADELRPVHCRRREIEAL